MEWFSTANANLPATELQRHIRVDNLGEWCSSPPAIDIEAARRAEKNAECVECPPWFG